MCVQLETGRGPQAQHLPTVFPHTHTRAQIYIISQDKGRPDVAFILLLLRLLLTF